VSAGRAAGERTGERARAGAKPRVVIVDDHHLFRSGVRAELGEELEVVGDAGTVAEAISVIGERRPDVVLLDVHMPDGGGVEVIRGTGERCEGVRFLALSVSDAPEDVIAVIRAGARGYVTKTISAAELAQAVRRVAGGDAVFSPRLAGFVLDAFAAEDPEHAGARGRGAQGTAELPLTGALHMGGHPEGHRQAGEQLTPREREVLRHIARGYMYKEVAQRLGISVKTVEAHVSAVLRKLQLSSRHELSRWALQRQLVSLD
jgi:DNA-binding NarL/FixJ family response regulator